MGSCIVTIALFPISSCFAQAGCTDPEASNYNSSAKTNDGSCTYAVTQKNVTKKGDFSSAIPESSGLVFTNGKLWTHNDSGNPASIFNVDTATGATLQTVFIDNYPNVDWEDISTDQDYIYISDCGNNNGTRKDLKILKIKKADIGTDTVAHVNAEAIALSYKDQTSFAASSTNNFDCESLIAIDTALYLFSKDRGDLSTRVYKLSKNPGTYIVSPYTSFNTNGLVTGADYDPIKKEVVLIGYMKSHLNSFLWILNDFKADSFFSGNKRRIEIGPGTEWQTEGVCYDRSGRLFISCESAGSYNAGLFVLDENWKPSSSSVSLSMKPSFCYMFPNPAHETVNIESSEAITHIVLENMMGQTLYSREASGTHVVIPLEQFSPSKGYYLVKIYGISGITVEKLILN